MTASPPMLSLEEIRNSSISEVIAREAYIQSSERLADVLDTKKVFEQKAQTFLAGYLTLALALFGAAGATVNSDSWSLTTLGLLFAGIAFVAGALLCAMSLHDANYAGAGASPKQWLYRGAIDASPNELPKLLTYLTWHRQAEIDGSVESNKGKAKLIRHAIYAGMVAPCILAVALIASLAGVGFPSGTNPGAAEAEVQEVAAGQAANSTCSCSCKSNH